jgi:twitching motility two-component system response regulator PilG
MGRQMAAHPELTLGGPSFRWVAAAEEEAEAARQAEQEAELKRLADKAEAQRLAEEEAKAAAEAEAAEAEAAKAEAAAEAKAAAEAEAEQSRLTEAAAAATAAAAAATAAVAVASSDNVEQTIQEDLTDLTAEVQETLQPAATAAPAPVAPTVEATAPSDEEMPLVLAVDDSPTIRKLLTMTLERQGFRIITAADGVEALTLLSEQLPDVILSDINMPRLGGYQLCKFVKKYDRTKHIPVIMLSGKDGVFDKMRGKMAGCNDYIVKPFESSELIAKVKEHAQVSV